MRWRVFLIFSFAWIFAIPLPFAHAAQTPQQQYLDIYVKIHDADQLEQQGDYRGALAAFQDCYARLLKIHDSDPDWETAMVSARLRDFKEKIADLTPKAQGQEAAPTPAPLDNNPTPSPTPSSTSPDMASLQQQLDDVKQELKAMTEKYLNSQSDAQTLRTQLEAVNGELKALKSQQPVDDQMGKLLTQNKDLTDKLAAAQKQLDNVQSPKALTLLRSQLKNTQDKLDAATVANDELQKAATTLRQQLDQAQTDLTTANQKLASAGAGSPEYDTLKRENEIMRGILTRELQEQAHRDMAKRLYQEEFDRLKINSKVLQEQVDILSSPMTPPTNDQERTLLATLKAPGPGPDLSPSSPSGGNVLSAPANGFTPSTTDTNAPPTTQPSTVIDTTTTPATNSTPSTDSSTNQPPVTVVSNNPTPDPTTSLTNTPSTNIASDTTTPSSTTPVDTTTTSSTPDPITGGVTPTTPAVTTPSTNTPDVNAAPTPAPSPMDNTPTVTHLPSATTTVTDTTIKNNNTAPQQADPSQYANKPLLPDDMKDTAQQAADLFKMQRYDEAAAKYQSIIDKYPESIYAWSNLGVVRFQQGNLNEALRVLQQAVKISPSDAFSYRSLGIVYYQMSQYDDAIGALERAIALDPNNVWSHDYLGCACAQKGWQEVAEKEFRKAIDIDETFGEAHFNLAVVYADSKPPSLELARHHYNRALELGVAKDPHLEKLLKQ